MHRLFQSLARLTALTGGLVLLGIIVLMTLSIIGRSTNKFLFSDFASNTFGGLSQWLLDLGIGEINGSYELLEAGVAFAIFSFLPVCQFYGAHATVDVFTTAMPQRVVRWIAAFWEIVLSVVIIFVIWRLYEGMQRYIGNGETTLFLQFPVWWAYAASFAAGVVACITAFYCAITRVVEAIQGRDILPSEHGEH